MAKSMKHGLGRGLDALLGGAPGDQATGPSPAAEPATEQAGDAVRLIAITDIDPNREQPRRQFDEQALDELAESIKSVGVIQPVILRPVEGRYQIIAGERRWRAARRAGLDQIPAIVRDWDRQTRLEVTLIENLQRDDLNAIEEAEGIRQLMQECGYTQEAAATRLGKSRSAIANLLRMLSLDERVKHMVRDGRLSAGHARALAGLSDPAMQVKLANLAASQGWSVRQIEKICQQTQKGAATQAPEPRPHKTHEAKELERMAREAFGTKAQLDGDMSRGKLSLHYYSAEDLQRIWDVLEILRQNQ